MKLEILNDIIIPLLNKQGCSLETSCELVKTIIFKNEFLREEVYDPKKFVTLHDMMKTNQKFFYSGGLKYPFNIGFKGIENPFLNGTGKRSISEFQRFVTETPFIVHEGTMEKTIYFTSEKLQAKLGVEDIYMKVKSGDVEVDMWKGYELKNVNLFGGFESGIKLGKDYLLIDYLLIVQQLDAEDTKRIQFMLQDEFVKFAEKNLENQIKLYQTLGERDYFLEKEKLFKYLESKSIKR